MQQLLLAKDEMAVWTWLVSKGISGALSGLSQMVGQEINVNHLDLKQYPAKDIVHLLGGPEKMVVGIYLVIHGDADGHLAMIYDPKMAFELVDMQLGLPPGTTQNLGEMERSVLGEMGNITGSFFLSTLSDATGLTLMPSPPAVMVDMVGAIMGIALANIMKEQEEVFLVTTNFGTDSRQINGQFVIMPTLDFMRTILRGPRVPCK